MNKPVYRPPSVWITQVLLIIALINLAIALPIRLFQCSITKPPFNCLSIFTINALLFDFLTLAIIFLTFWGLQKRKRYGKWLAVSLLVGGMVVGIFESNSFQLIYHSITQWQPLPAPPYECWEKNSSFNPISPSCGYHSYGELFFRIVLEVSPALLLGFLAVRLLCSDAVKRFFQ